jgi:hypothetical protein
MVHCLTMCFSLTKLNYLLQEIYSVKLPGNPKLGEGKPENQNHAVIFTRGNAVQTIDMNQVLVCEAVRSTSPVVLQRQLFSISCYQTYLLAASFFAFQCTVSLMCTHLSCFSRSHLLSYLKG